MYDFLNESQQKLTKKNILLFSKDALNWSKVTINTFWYWIYIHILNKCFFKSYFDISIHQRIMKNASWFPQNIKQ